MMFHAQVSTERASATPALNSKMQAVKHLPKISHSTGLSDSDCDLADELLVGYEMGAPWLDASRVSEAECLGGVRSAGDAARHCGKPQVQEERLLGASLPRFLAQVRHSGHRLAHAGCVWQDQDRSSHLRPA